MCNIIQLSAQILSRVYNLQLLSEEVKSTLITVLYLQNEMNCEKCVTQIKTKKETKFCENNRTTIKIIKKAF